MSARILVLLQCFQLAILLLHDWVPLGSWNDLPAARKQHSQKALALGTFVSSLFPLIGLVLSVAYWNSGWPRWLYIYLLAAYGFLFIGEVEAWWIPYLVWSQPKRAAEYAVMYSNTFAFLPARNGLRINALQCVLHAATLVTVLILISYFVRP